MTSNPDNYRPAPNGWTEHAACTGLGHLMYPDAKDQYGIGSATLVCMNCPVRFECLKQAMDTGETWGIWGGLTYDERTSLRRRVARHNLRVRNGEAVTPLVLDDVIATVTDISLDDFVSLAREIDEEEDAA